MPKYAELPGGKLLKFPDDISDKEMQRAVRRELGYSQQDLEAAFLKFTESFEDISAGLNKQAERHRESLSEVSDTFGANANRIAGELSDAIKAIGKAQEKLGADLLKAMQAQVSLVSKLHVAMESLNKTLDAALGQSLEAMDRSMAHDGAAKNGLATHLAQLGVLTERMERVAEVIHAAAHVQRTVHRNRDGTYSMRVDAQRHH